MSVSADLQDLALRLLRADAGVAALVAGRVYDRAPSQNERSFPDITFGPSDVVEDGADCIESGEHTLQIDVWCRDGGQLGAKRIVDAVKRALHEADGVIASGAVVELRVDFRRVITEADGETAHGVVRLTAMIEEGE